MHTKRWVAALAALALAAGVAACGDDEEETTAGDAATEETASAEEVTVTTGDVEGGFSWEVEPTPTTETQTFTYVNESEQPHALIFAKINEGYTFEEANELEGRQGSAELLAQGEARPGQTEEVEVRGEVEPGNYALFCPIPGHYEQGQLEEFEIS